MGRPIKKGSTDQSTVIRIIDSTDGTPENAVEHNTAGIDLWWRREKETKTSITEVALAALDSAHSDGGIELIGDGYYRLDLPDAAVAAGSGENSVQIGGTLTGMIVIGNEHALVDYDPYDSVRMGMTALPNAAADAAGGVPISDAGGLDLDAKLANTDEVTTVRMEALTDWINGGRLDLLLDAIPTTAMRGTDNAALASVLGALNDVAAGGDPTDADTLMQYIKQLINVLIGTTGIAAFPAEAAPANAVSLAEVIRAIHVDVTGLNGDAMVGTNGANTTVPDAAGVAPTAIEIQAEMEENGASLLDTIRDIVSSGTYGNSALQVLMAALQTDLDNGTDGLGALKTLIDTVNTDLSNGTDGLGALKILIDALNNVSTSDLATALTNIHLDHLLAADYDPASKPGTATALLNELVENDGGVSRFTENALEQAPSGSGGDATEAKQDTIITHLTDVKGGTFAGATDSLEALRDRGDAAWTTGSGGTAGAGAITWEYTLTDADTGGPIAGADVWVTTDSAGSNVVASGVTDSYGKVTFYLDAGDYFIWRQLAGYDFDNPDLESVS